MAGSLVDSWQQNSAYVGEKLGSCSAFSNTEVTTCDGASEERSNSRISQKEEPAAEAERPRAQNTTLRSGRHGSAIDESETHARAKSKQVGDHRTQQPWAATPGAGRLTATNVTAREHDGAEELGGERGG